MRAIDESEATHRETAAVRELVVEGTDDALFGVTFDDRLGRRRLVVASGYRLFRLAPDRAREVDELETFPARGGLAWDGRYLWQRTEDELQQLDPRTALVVREVAPDLEDVTGVECIGHDLLVLHAGGRSLARVETLDATVLARADTSTPLRGLGWAVGELWSAAAGELVRIDPASARILARLPLPSACEVCDVAGDDEDRLWCVDGKSRVVRAFARPRSS